MRKLTLKLDALSVETFEITSSHAAHGTVLARETLESECVCPGASKGCQSVESCTHCGCDTPGFTCEERCFPPVTDVKEIDAKAAVIG
ncbi:MAG TPA: hypothetical protein VFQ39_01860 [Longimicrobium sp.]|nr:hypothetical protein [Longimicrobium sp.]